MAGLTMTRDHIIALANQTAGQHWMDEAHVLRFAALIAAVERERNAQIADARASIEGIAQAIAAEIRGQQ